MKTFFAIALVVLAVITAWNTMEFWFYSHDVNALREEVDAIQQQLNELQGLKHPATPLPDTKPDVTPTPDHPPPLDPRPDRPDTSKPDSGGPYYNDNWGWCRELQKADPAFKC
jgi:hypothetical protein